MILTTFSTAGAVVAMPYTFGLLGYGLGTCCLLAWALLQLLMMLRLVDVALLSRARALSDVGAFFYDRRGRNLLGGFQIVSLAFYCPAVLTVVASCLQYWTAKPAQPRSWRNCSGIWTVLTWAGLAALLQLARKYKTTAWWAYFTVAAIMLLAWVLLIIGAALYPNPLPTGPSPAWAGANGGVDWSAYTRAFANIPYGFSIVFVLVETMGEMRKPHLMRRAVATSTAVMCAIYLVPGLVYAALWGWNVLEPVTKHLSGAIGSLANLALLLATCLDFMIAARIVTIFVHRRFYPDKFGISVPAGSPFTWASNPSIDLADQGSWEWLVLPGRKEWLASSCIPLLLSLALAVLIPSYPRLKRMLFSLTIVLSSSALPGLLWLLKRNRLRLQQQQQQAEQHAEQAAQAGLNGQPVAERVVSTELWHRASSAPPGSIPSEQDQQLWELKDPQGGRYDPLWSLTSSGWPVAAMMAACTVLGAAVACWCFAGAVQAVRTRSWGSFFCQF